MTWIEPMTAAVSSSERERFTVTVRDGAGVAVAAVPCDICPPCGAFGSIEFLDAGGTQRQRLRALVLLVREALRFAEAAGVTHVRTEATPEMLAFARRLTGIEGRALKAGGALFAGELQAIRTLTLNETNAAGNFRRGDP